ncbi:YraN family protein [Ruegeria pomeroyi]|uniref:YraN family protein n=1 Tax=Ruegeria pomeroyi TaxID=89184 RepID=UPI001F20B088|nr:YraN family protein [Ruegeria pomeroyi]MCE8510515.1 YraN family protein [Ruegeria pomeroyi]
MRARRLRGSRNHLAGVAAEHSVASDYERRGYRLARRRWRGTGGEIDLIARSGDEVIFVEVKHSRDFARAAESLCGRQMARLHAAAAEYLADEPAGQLTSMRFDVALVDGTGQLEIIENAFGHG